MILESRVAWIIECRGNVGEYSDYVPQINASGNSVSLEYAIQMTKTKISDHGDAVWKGGLAYYAPSYGFHRYDGPAIDKKDPSKDRWYLFGKAIYLRKYLTWLYENGMDINNLSDNDKILIGLKWNHRTK